MAPGTNTIGRIAAVGPHSPYLKPGMLVFYSGVVRSRDDNLATPFLQVAKWYIYRTSQSPLESVHVLIENVLIKELGDNIEDLGYLGTPMVSYGGLSNVGLRAGETIAIAPATGSLGSGAVFVALAMGAGKVITIGRNETNLKQVLVGPGDRVVTVPITGDVERDTAALQAHSPVDVYFDITPGGASTMSHIKSGIASLQTRGWRGQIC